ncbi:MAG: general stress protein [Gammaproteobacteria bacterium]|jgi:hypothetical protein
MNKENTLENTVIAAYDTHEQAERAVKDLNKSGFDMKKLSIVAKGYRTEEYPLGFYSTADRVKAWSGIAAFWGALWGVLATILIFGWEPIPFLMAPTTPFLQILEGAIIGAALAGGIAALGALVASWSNSGESILKYERRLGADSYLVVAHGGNDEIEQARSLMTHPQATETAAFVT